MVTAYYTTARSTENLSMRLNGLTGCNIKIKRSIRYIRTLVLFLFIVELLC